MKGKTVAITAILLTALVAGVFTASSVSAQGGTPATPPAPAGGPFRGNGLASVGILACSTTDYTSVVAKALNMTAPDLRVALVSGKNLQDLATSKNVTYQSLVDAVNAARKADIAQAVTDGLLTQAQADALTNRLNQAAPAMGRNAMMARGLGAGLGVSPYNTVRPLTVAAQAIGGTTCADLVKAMQQGKSIVQVASDKNVKAQPVIDALVTAYQNASAQDVKEGLITQAQADGRNANLVQRVTALISRSGRQGGGVGAAGALRGMFGNLFGGNGANGRNGTMPFPRGPRNGQPGQPGAPGDLRAGPGRFPRRGERQTVDRK